MIPQEGPGKDPHERARFRIIADDPGGDATVPIGAELQSNGAIFVIAGRPRIGLWFHSPGMASPFMVAPTVDLVEPLNDAARAMLAVLQPPVPAITVRRIAGLLGRLEFERMPPSEIAARIVEHWPLLSLPADGTHDVCTVVAGACIVCGR